MTADGTNGILTWASGRYGAGSTGETGSPPRAGRLARRRAGGDATAASGGDGGAGRLM